MKYLIFLILILALIGGGWYLYQTPKAEAPNADTNTETTNTHDPDNDGDDHSGMDMDADTGTHVGTDVGMDLTGEAMIDAPDATFNISGKNFAFSTKEIRVKEGDIVRINFTSESGTHDWVVDEFEGAKTPVLRTGGTASITFVADKKGTFEYYCSIGSHRQMGMVGNLIVE